MSKARAHRREGPSARHGERLPTYQAASGPKDWASWHRHRGPHARMEGGGGVRRRTFLGLHPRVRPARRSAPPVVLPLVQLADPHCRSSSHRRNQAGLLAGYLCIDVDPTRATWAAALGGKRRCTRRRAPPPRALPGLLPYFTEGRRPSECDLIGRDARHRAPALHPLARSGAGRVGGARGPPSAWAENPERIFERPGVGVWIARWMADAQGGLSAVASAPARRGLLTLPRNCA